MGLKNATGQIELKNIGSVRIMQSGVSGDSLISRKREEPYIISVTDAEGLPAPFKYSVDRDDDEVLVIIGSDSHKVTIDSNKTSKYGGWRIDWNRLKSLPKHSLPKLPLAIAIAFLLATASAATAQYRSSGRHLNGLCQILIKADTLPCSQLAITGEDLDPSAGLNFQFQTGNSALVFVTSKKPYKVERDGYSYYTATGMAFREADGTFSNITKLEAGVCQMGDKKSLITCWGKGSSDTVITGQLDKDN